MDVQAREQDDWNITCPEIDMVKVVNNMKGILKVRKLQKGNIPKELEESPLFLYGAGYTGRHCLKALEEYHVRVDALVDDDAMKQGALVDTYRVISYEELANSCKNFSHVNVILTSIYGKAIYDKLLAIPNIEALEGGVGVIRRDNPLLAISIYHSVEDYYRIMQFLLRTEGGIVSMSGSTQ